MVDIIHVSSAKRLTLFKEAVVANHLLPAKLPSYRAYYKRLFLTRRAAEFILSALIIFGGHQLVIINTFFSPVWPMAGVALSALFLRGNALLFGLFAGTLASYLYNGYLLPLSLGQSLLFIFFMYLIRALSLKWIGSVSPLINRATFWKFVLVCAMVCATHVWAMGILFVQTYDSSFSLFGWSVAFLGELNGILCLTPLCLVFDPFVPLQYFRKKESLWQISALVLILCHLGYFFVPSGIASIMLASGFLVLLCGYALYFGLIPICVTLFGISVIYLAGALPNAHLFHSTSEKADTLALIALFTISIVLSISIGIAKQGRYYDQHPLT